MKITNLVLSLTLAGLCFNQASAQGIKHPAPAASRSIGDSALDSRPENFQAARNLSDSMVNYATALDQSILAPTAGSSQPDYDNYVGCSESVGCETGSCGAGLGTSVCGTGSSMGWFSAETLLWFGKKTYSPALVNTNDFGVFPENGVAGTQTVYGGNNGIDFGLIPGFRLSAGVYLDDCQKVGVGGRGYGLFPKKSTYARASDGSGNPDNPSIGVPFYNLFLNREDSLLVAYQDGGGPDRAGLVRARSDLDMYGADGSLYLLLSRSEGHRMDLLGGYTYNILRNSIGIETITQDFRFPSTGNVTTTNDLFETENVFNGGHLGVLSSVVRSRVSLSTLAKISFGNMRQTSTIRGYSIVQDALLNQNAFGAGILTQPSNIGVSSRNNFGFIPELGLKLGLCARENIQFTVGYTMMMWSGVALAGEQIDSAVDPTQLIIQNAGTRPTPLFKESTFWMQGVDLGMTVAF